ncbi:MAG: GPW/gp25 family protein [Cellulomonas sp.]
MTHVSFPLRLDARGRTDLVDDEPYLRGLVEQVLFTRPGERVNRPELGSGVDRLVFAPADDALARSTSALVHGALQQWLGDLLRIEDVEVRSVDAMLDVTIVYSPLQAPVGERRVLRVSSGSSGGAP